MIKLFEQFNNEQKIKDICTKYKIEKYTINPDGSIDVNGNVDLYSLGLTEIPLKFNRVSGSFNCSFNQLTSLIGSPNYVDMGFYCSGNQLTSLEGSPEHVGNNFYCSYNKLISLEGSPEHVGGSLDCSYNQLTSLKGSPIVIKGDFYCRNNPICIVDTSVEVKVEIYIDDTNFDDKIKSLDQEKLRILFEYGIDYGIFNPDGTIKDNRLQSLFNDFKF